MTAPALYGLTPAMADAARVIGELVEATGWAPSVRELARELGIGATAAHALRRALVERGWLDPETGRLTRASPPLPADCAVEITDLGRRAIADHIRRAP